MGTGWEQRLEILKRDAQRKIIDPLLEHRWTVNIEGEFPQGEYIKISAERGGYRHQIALLYSCATSNEVYQKLAAQVERIFFNGQPYHLDQYSRGIAVPVGSADDFHHVLLEWNAGSADGKFAPPSMRDENIDSAPTRHRILLSEEPIKAIWLRLRQIQSVNIAKRIIIQRSISNPLSSDVPALQTKAEGLAYAVRNASDYFHASDNRNVSQRVLNLYYGSLSFAFAEMLASPSGPTNLAEIESSTKQGHGLATVDGDGDSLENLVVVSLTQGFFPVWMKFLSQQLSCAARKPRNYSEVAALPAGSWVTAEQLFAAIPEVSDLFADVFNGAPRSITPIYDHSANMGFSFAGKKKPVERTYIQLFDETARLTREDIANFPGPISEICEVQSTDGGRRFRAAVEHAGKRNWHEVLNIHHSPFERSSLIIPIFGGVGEYRAICVALLYALSIIVRYRPSVWRRIQEGDLDHLRAIIEAFLVVVERVLPEQFLERISGQRVFVKQPGGF